mmetsp:Transcript_2310/g.5168  ORF Transcript_2310/g.5168 Transcript_2310/m.5168 type:complete len:215 (-) Transcript_2310:1300-1944(-)
MVPGAAHSRGDQNGADGRHALRTERGQDGEAASGEDGECAGRRHLSGLALPGGWQLLVSRRRDHGFQHLPEAGEVEAVAGVHLGRALPARGPHGWGARHPWGPCLPGRRGGLLPCCGHACHWHEAAVDRQRLREYGLLESSVRCVHPASLQARPVAACRHRRCASLQQGLQAVVCTERVLPGLFLACPDREGLREDARQLAGTWRWRPCRGGAH